MAGDPFVNLDRLLILDFVRIQLQRFVEAVDRLSIPIAIEIGETEVVDRLFVLRVELDRTLKVLDCALELSLVVKNRAEEKVGLRNGFDLHGLLEELLCAKKLSLARVDRAERKVRQERVL